MKVLVTGVKGQLGYDVMNELAKRGYEGVGVDVAEMDITDSAAVEKVISEVHPDKVVHCAAWTAVDAAEDNQEVCHKVNVDGTANIAKMCGKLDIPMIYISTDYVFDGQGIRPWEPDDPVVEPLNVYGQSKYERIHIGLRNITDRDQTFQGTFFISDWKRNNAVLLHDIPCSFQRHSLGTSISPVSQPSATEDLASDSSGFPVIPGSTSVDFGSA